MAIRILIVNLTNTSRQEQDELKKDLENNCWQFEERTIDGKQNLSKLTIV